MIPLILAAITPGVYMGYQSLAKKAKLGAGQLIVRELCFTALWACLLFTFTVPYVNVDFLTWVGCPITVENYGAMLSCASVIFVIYIGPLVQTAFIEDEGAEFNLPELKSYVTDAFCIELLFRVCFINLALIAGLEKYFVVMLAALVFAAVKVRHVFEGLTLQNARKNKKMGEIYSEIVFTLAFSALLAYMYVQTASYLACVVVHVFKNFMGFPDLGFVYKDHLLYKYRWVIATAYVVGILSFIVLTRLILMDSTLFSPWLSNLTI